MGTMRASGAGYFEPGAARLPTARASPGHPLNGSHPFVTPLDEK